MQMLPVGAILCSIDSQRYTNAIVIKVDKDHTTVLSDFGNEMKFDNAVLFEHYTISNNWIEAVNIFYPLPTIPERIRQQIELLQSALEKYQD